MGEGLLRTRISSSCSKVIVVVVEVVVVEVVVK